VTVDTYLVAGGAPVCQFAQPASGVNFWPRSTYHPDTAGVVSFKVELDRLNQLGLDTTVEFDFAGSAEMHVDFSEITHSPIVIGAAETVGWITVRLLRDARFWTERELQIRLRSVSDGALMGRFNVHRAYLRSTLEAPQVQHTSQAAIDIAQGADPRAVPIEISLTELQLAESISVSTGKFGNNIPWPIISREESIVPYALSGTAVKDTDFTISPDSPLVIPAGARSANLLVTTLDPATAKTLIITLAPPIGSIRRNLLSYSHIGEFEWSRPRIVDQDDTTPPWDKSFGKPSDWWAGCNNVPLPDGWEKRSSLRHEASGTNPDGTTAYRYYSNADLHTTVYGCILKTFDGDLVGASFDKVHDANIQGGKWNVLSAYCKESDSEYFSLTLLDRTVQASSTPELANHSVYWRWVAGEPTVFDTDNLASPDHWGVLASDPLAINGWKRIYLAWKAAASNDGDVSQMILRPVLEEDGTILNEHGTLFWGTQFEYGTAGTPAGDVSAYQPVDGMHFWPHECCTRGLFYTRTINLLGP